MLLSRQQLVAGPTHTLNGLSTHTPLPIGVNLIRKDSRSTAAKPRLHNVAPGAASSGDSSPLENKLAAQKWIDNWRSRQKLSPLNQRKLPSAAQPSEPSSGAKASQNELASYLQMWAGLGVMYVADVAIKIALDSAGIKFPGPLVGMACVVVALLAVGNQAAEKALAWFGPSLQWIAKWLPLFYVASLVTLPLNLSGIAGDQLGKIVIILSVGMVGTLLFTAQAAVSIRSIVKTENKEVGKASPASPLLPSHWIAWGAILVTSLAATLAAPSTLGAQMALPFNLAATILGFLLGSAMPKGVQAVLHPVVMCALVANAGAAVHGSIMNVSYETAQKVYYSKSAEAMGAGDLLMSFLGVVIISMGFRIYQQRETMKRHAPEILGATLLSSLFSFFSTALAAKALGLQADLARACVPRSVTVALALPISAQLDAPAAITAAVVLTQGMLGANFGPSLMSALGYKDTIARGLAAAATAGGLGTASLTSKEPEALPFCALSYSMVGVISTFLATIPAVRSALITIIQG
ncbi:LrgB-like family-domain-containing protein [Dunaliella salina]|uniref:LrgB-like family-domain-containing protein n=1 Tax=Dunaliella salina TaxID=3046 RepID=A0ABQ7G0L8_DUNSA|nr:LrgB-like family-domain-containing protein [Dunaliella salina]|eukprot:KAF5828144.1 LrgB-like family-domain-containing protein [Dunaliella salina]